jgi:hypothetical protein
MGTLQHAVFAIMFLLAASTATAQFNALPDSNAAWTETFWIGPGYPYEGFFHTYDTTSPDTIYNGEVYQKLLTTYSNNFMVWGTGYGGALRDNGLGQVYYWASGEPAPALLYDFDVQVGDTVEDVYSIWTQDVRVYSVDQIEVNGTLRKRIGLECLDQPGFIGAYWIQGIGGSGGLFRTSACLSVSGVGALVCMTANDTVQWGGNVGAVGDCSLLLSQSELAANEESLLIYPNPATDRLSISHGGNARMDVEVIGPDGRQVLALPLFGKELLLSALPAGAYVLKVREATGTVRVARFVKH